MKKNTIHRILALFYIVVLVVCVLIVIKPGASIFYFKKTVDNRKIIPEAGFAYSFSLKINPLFFRPQGSLLYENGNQLDRSDGKTVIDSGEGAYSLSELSRGTANIFFSSSDNTNPLTNGRKYTLYIPLSFVSRYNGIIYLFILLPILAWFLFFMLAIPGQRKTLVKSPRGILTVLERFFDLISEGIAPDTGPVWQKIKGRTFFWKRLFAITILAALFYIFMEWLFFVTKPSFMSILSLPEKVEVLILSGLALCVSSMLVLAAFIGLDLIAVIAHRSRLTRHPGAILPSLILSGLGLILVDNFTYTIFKFGISSSAGVWRGVYGLLFILLSIYIYIQMLKYFGLRGKEIPKRSSSNRLFYFAVGILVISTGLAVTRLDFKKLTSANNTTVFQQTTRHPNIILLGSDGVNARNMSVYGYERDTTPVLRELAPGALVAENAFTNSGNTPGSVFSLLTGKLPTTTRVGFSPDILTGLDAFQHLPGILKSAGYKTVEFGIPVFLDAYDFNMQNAFDMVDGRSQSSGNLGAILQKTGFDNAAYFMDTLTGRISDRIQHIFYLRDMQNPIDLVTEPADSLSDQEKINQLLDLFDQAEQPLFVHVHLMGTHGVKFAPPVQVFSKGKKQDQTWMVDYYDDAILAFDHSIGEVIDHLKASGQYENTLLIIYSDHDMQWRVNQQIPLIMRFPADGFARQVTQNVQNLDIAPTILDYMGLPIPDWMGGESLLRSNPDSHRLIFAMGTIQATQSNGSGERFINPELIKPPFYQFGYVNIIDCQKWYRFNLETSKWASGDVKGNVDPCPQQSPLSFEEIQQEMVHRLALDGFDTSSLP